MAIQKKRGENQGVANIRVERPVGDKDAKMETSELVNYFALSVAVKGTDKFDWEIREYSPV